jgi:alpha-L-glutamate ligase-like protein
MNDRNYTYQRLNNGKRHQADNKILTKKVLSKNDIPVPETYGIVRNHAQNDIFDYDTMPSSFVLKPARGVKGAGIYIYYNRARDGRWILANRNRNSIEDIKNHVNNILEGQYSLGITPRPSAAIMEERVKMHPAFKPYSYRGIPDIRVIVYKGIPIMAMLRLPTKESMGKANVALGAIGVGIDMARGVTTTAVKNGISIEKLPGSNLPLSGIKIPFWTKILRISHRTYKATGLGFLGVDIIIDREKGPLVVELNARPGLSIQVANQAGLKERLLRVKKLKNISEDRAVRIAKDLFGGEIEEEVAELTGRTVIGLKEDVIFYGKNGEEVKVKIKVDTGADSSSIDENLVSLLGYQEAVENFKKKVTTEIKNLPRQERRATVRKLDIHEDILSIVSVKSASGYDYRIRLAIPAKIGDKSFVTHATIANRIHLEYPAIIGRKDLGNFLIDPAK